MRQNVPGSPSGSPPPSGAPGRLTDNHSRTINYLRLAITDRCNLRCRYCRPEKGVPFLPHGEILSFEELERLGRIFCDLGVTKVRVTGGEPFSRRGGMDFLRRLRCTPGLESLHVTTNGVKTGRYLDELAELGIAGLNLSLDTLDPQRFWEITRRDYLATVLRTMHGILARGITLKINSVILKETTDVEIVDLVGLVKKHPLTLRFIERMPFSGTARSEQLETINLRQRLNRIFPAMEPCRSAAPTTARLFSLPGHRGKLGIIEGYSRLFCADCNKVRITPLGMLKTCLYDDGALDLKNLLRQGASDEEIKNGIVSSVRNRFADGHEAARFPRRATEPSMGMIGG
jgi:GTP 3',8-cyclase